MIKTWKDIMAEARFVKRHKIVVAGAEDILILKALRDAVDLGLIEPILVGNKQELKRCCRELTLTDWPLIEAGSAEIAEVAVRLVRSTPGALLMKGRISTADLMKAVLNRQTGIRTNRLLSHVAAVETSGYHKLLFITDGAINLRPDTDTLEDITTNVIEFVRRLGIDHPRTALIALVESVNPRIKSTQTAHEIAIRFPDELIEGPLSLDIALSTAAAQAKNFSSRIAGETDILVMPNATTCNVVVKALRLVGGAKIGGVVLGAQIPIILVSRSDDANSKLRSIVLSVTYQEKLNSYNAS